MLYIIISTNAVGGGCIVKVDRWCPSLRCVGRGAEWTSSHDQFTSPAHLLDCGDAGQQAMSVATWSSSVRSKRVGTASASSRIIGQRQERVGDETDAGHCRRSLDEETQELGSFCFHFTSENIIIIIIIIIFVFYAGDNLVILYVFYCDASGLRALLLLSRNK